VLFGCGGNRDQNKRSKMGKIASDFADVSFLQMITLDLKILKK